MKKSPLSPSAGLELKDLGDRRLLRSLLPLSCAFIGAAFGMVSLGLYAHASSRLTVVPYVITVDRTGAVIARDDLQGSRAIPEQALAADLAGFIEDLRLISQDRKLEELAVRRVYARLKENSQAFTSVERFYTVERPKIRDEGCNAQVENILRVSDREFQIDWCELTENERQSCMRAQLGYELMPPGNDLTTLRFNPLGIRISSLILSPRDPFVKEAAS